MSITRLSTISTPGRLYSFSAKTSTEKGLGIFTELSLIGVPGQRKTFLPKTTAGPISGKGLGPFTELSVLSLPGLRHTFLAKTTALIQEPDSGGSSSFKTKSPYTKRPFITFTPNVAQQISLKELISSDDHEIMELIPIILGVIYN